MWRNRVSEILKFFVGWVQALRNPTSTSWEYEILHKDPLFTNHRGAARNPVSLVGVKNRDVECGETGLLGSLNP
jgi:hypothetical protein